MLENKAIFIPSLFFTVKNVKSLFFYCIRAIISEKLETQLILRVGTPTLSSISMKESIPLPNVPAGVLC